MDGVRGVIEEVHLGRNTSTRLYLVYVDGGMEHLEAGVDLDPDLLLNPDPCILLLLGLHLFQFLPQLIPKTTVVFGGRLNEPVIKHLELTNPSNRPLVYNVRLEGSPEFSAADSLKIGPRDKVKFPVTCLHTQRLPSVGESTEAQIFFMGERVPGPQSWHMSLSVAPTWALKVPAGHGEHSESPSPGP